VRDVPTTDFAPLHPGLAPLAFLLGKWAGEGEGDYPTVERFHYGEETSFSHVGKPFIAYTQRSWDLDDGRPLHTEMGYWRAPSPGTIELVVAHPTGHVELSGGSVAGRAIRLSSSAILGAPTSKRVEELVRTIEVNGDELSYQLHMAALGNQLSSHLQAVLRKVSGL
jgi:hypothetical protein